MEYLRKHFRNHFITSIEIDSLDRCICFRLQKGDVKSKFLYFFKGHEVYFVHEVTSENKAIKSWSFDNKVEINNNAFEYFDEVGRKSIDQTKGPTNESIDLYFEYLSKLKRDKSFGKKKKKLTKKIKAIEKDIDKLKIIENFEKEIINATKIDDDFKFNWVKLKLYGMKFYQKRDKLFERLKKLKRGRIVAKERLESTRKELDLLKEDQEIVNLPKSKMPVWKYSNKEQSSSKKCEYEQIFFKNLEIRVGKNSASNDLIRSSWSKKEDYWFHIDNRSSSHAYVKTIKGTLILDQELFELLGCLLNDASKLHLSEIDLIYTKCKYLNSVKGSPGSVIFKKEKRVRVIYSSEWRKKFL